jgi:hypothetical protein
MTTSAPPPDDAADGALPDRPRSAATWYAVLEVPRSVDHAGLLLAWERAVDFVEGRRPGTYAMLEPAAAAAARVDIDAAFAILSDDERRSAYDRSLDGDDADVVRRTNAPRTSTPLRFLAPVDDTASDRLVVRKGGIVFAAPKTDVHDVAALVAAAREHAAEVAKAPVHFEAPTLVPTSTVLPTETMDSPWEPIAAEPVAPSSERRVGVPSAPTPTPTPLVGLFSLDGEVNGSTIKRMREARKISLDTLAELTKIRRPYLVAIEEHDAENLPSRVYLRGFLTQIARVLRVDKVKLSEGYLAFIARFGG